MRLQRPNLPFLLSLSISLPRWNGMVKRCSRRTTWQPTCCVALRCVCVEAGRCPRGRRSSLELTRRLLQGSRGAAAAAGCSAGRRDESVRPTRQRQQRTPPPPPPHVSVLRKRKRDGSNARSRSQMAGDLRAAGDAPQVHVTRSVDRHRRRTFFF